MSVSVVVGLLVSYGAVRVVRGLLGVGGTVSSRMPVWRPALTLRAAAALTAAALGGGLTGWPAAGFIAAVGALAFPSVVQSRREDGQREAGAGAVGTWVRMVGDDLAASAGIETAIRATVRASDGVEPPEAIRNELDALIARLDHGVPLTLALRMLGDELDDEHADMAIMVLIRASEHQSGRVVEQLTVIADGIDEEWAGRQGVTTERGKTRNSVIAILLFLSVAGTFYLIFRKSYFAPFSTVAGEAALLIAGAGFGTGISLLVRMARPYRAVRLLTPLGSSERRDAAAVTVGAVG